LRALQYYISYAARKRFFAIQSDRQRERENHCVCGFNPPARGYDTELMYHLLKSAWGKGYATEAAKGCIDFAKRELTSNKIGASVDLNNQLLKSANQSGVFNLLV
jgi:RimJ/RimL family protein N-acetyltransferase